MNGDNDRKLLLRRFRSVGAIVIVGAVIGGLHCSSGVIDPAQPPPQQCATLADPFATITASGRVDSNDGGGTSGLVYITLEPRNTAGFTLDAVRVTAGGAVVEWFSQGFWWQIEIAADPSTPPDANGFRQLLFEVDIACGATATTLHFGAQLPPSPFAGEMFGVGPV
jgi:hypothetical protein